MAWFRWYENATNDPKFMVAARRSGQSVAFVIAVWAMLLERASESSDRGSIDGFDCESADALLGMPDGAAEAIVQALRGKGMLNGERVTKWEERQPVRERTEESPSTDRVRKHRERLREERNAEEQQYEPCNAHETPCNAMKHHETPRGEEIRGERKERENTASPSPSAPPAAEHVHVCPPFGEGGDVPTPSVAPPSSRSSSRGKSKNQPPPDEPHYRAKSGLYLTGKRLASFERFWADFAFAKGKAEAADAWLDIAQLTDALVNEICRAAALEAQKRVEDTAKGKSPKWAQGWLTSRRWEDYEAQPTPVRNAVAMPVVPEVLAPTPEQMEENRQRGLRMTQTLREKGFLRDCSDSVPVRADFHVLPPMPPISSMPAVSMAGKAS